MSNMTNLQKLFDHRNCKIDTELSYEFWKINDKKRSAKAYNTRSKRCSLSLNEKMKIALHRNNTMLNKQTEILNKSRHENKYALISYDSKD